MSASGRRAASWVAGTRGETSSEQTRHSRTRRAINWEYWPPRSTTRTGRSSGGGSGSWTTTASAIRRSPFRSLLAQTARHERARRDYARKRVEARGGPDGSGQRGPARSSHPDPLRLLQRLALRLDRRRQHDLRALEVMDVLVPARRHRRTKRAHQV